MSPTNYSAYQLSIFSAVRSTADNIIISATAGSGKTTTLVSLFEFLQGKSVCMLAFNKAIAAELGQRAPSNVTCATFHSLGKRVWDSYSKGSFLDKDKTSQLIFRNYEEKVWRVYIRFIIRIVGLAKNAAIIPGTESDTVEAWEKLAAHYDCIPEHSESNLEEGIRLAREVLSLSVKDKSTIDFDDMLFMPIAYGLNFPTYDVVCVDEAQDTNPLQLAILASMLRAGGRLVAVGDESQAIYGFRGADSEAMARIKERFSCRELPLSLTYRCAKAIVECARQFDNRIKALDNAPEGEVLSNPETFTIESTDGILCRNTAPLIKVAYALLAKKHPVKILGRDIGEGMADLVRRMECSDIDSLSAKLSEYLAREVDRLTQANKGEQAQAVTDRVDAITVCISMLPESARSIRGLLSAIDSLFCEKTNGQVTLATIHKSKGLEFPRVFIIDAAETMPSKYATQEHQLRQENNLHFVAITRAKHTLIYMASENFKRAPEGAAVIDTERSVQVERAPDVGDKVRVIRGKNVPIGTIANITARGKVFYGKQTVRIDYKTAGRETYIPLEYLERVR